MSSPANQEELSFLSVFFCVCVCDSTGVSTHGLTLASQVLYYLSHNASLFFSLQDRSCVFALDQLQTIFLLPMLLIAGLTDVYHNILLVEMGVSTFLPSGLKV
jgi:hypothetical protein